MKRKTLLRRLGLIAATAALSLPSPLWASSPIPSFDKEAVTDYPYMRTGGQDVEAGGVELPERPQPGNTGTVQDPAFKVEKIVLTGYPLKDPWGELEAILARYSGRDLRVAELNLLTWEITQYSRRIGVTIPLAVIPPQSVDNGVLEVRVHAAAFDEVKIVSNDSTIPTALLEKYLANLREGQVILDRRLEMAMNNLNDLPGVRARGTMKPGEEPATTSLDVEIEKRKVWNSYIFADNGGGHYSGRYRFGLNAEVNNPFRWGDKFVVSGLITDEDTDNYSFRYEFPLGSMGTRLGIAYSKTSYEFASSSLFDTLGESEGLSIYGMTPLWRNRANRLTLIYGYDHREITDQWRFRGFNIPGISLDKEADVWHIGLSGSHYDPGQFLQYSLIYWYGDIETDNGGAYYDGGYHKLTGDVLKIWYDRKFNYRVRARGQLASGPLDGSEQFYLGGINGVRAYGYGDGYGDSAFVATGEVRWDTGISGLELAAFIDVGAAKNLATGETDHQAGGGIGLRYAKSEDWYFQLDYAHKIDGREDRSEPGNDDGRIWFQLYKMF